MRSFNIDFNRVFKTVLIIYAAFFIVGIVFMFVPSFGVKLDINFSGGTKLAYSYEEDIDDAEIESAVKEVIDNSFTVSKSTSLAGDTKTFEITLVGRESISAETQEELTGKLSETFGENDITLYNSNSVSPNIAGTFFAKSLVAVLITAVLVVIYVGIRFRRIGGVSAAVTALLTLIFDVLVTFFVCVIFRLQIDSNYIAVVLTILGYSLNDTIVIYDRVRENEGAAYSPYAGGRVVSTYEDKFVIQSMFGLNPDKREISEKLTIACLEDLAKNIPEAELNKMKEMQKFIGGLVKQGNRIEVIMMPE